MSETKKFFKIRTRHKDSSRELWLPIRGNSIGEAVVIADNRCFGKPFALCDGLESFVEISESEYHRTTDSALRHGTLESLG